MFSSLVNFSITSSLTEVHKTVKWKVKLFVVVNVMQWLPESLITQVIACEFNPHTMLHVTLYQNFVQRCDYQPR